MRRHYTPGPTTDAVTVPVLPVTLQKEALQQCHDLPQAGHQGAQKTHYRLRRMAYWVNMAQDVESHCKECTVCQHTKPTMPMRVQMTSVPIGRPWQMIAMDILEVPVSSNNNRYLLVVQDYFTKWADARPLPDQTASRITTELVDLFTTYGVPEIVHSGQGRNFKSASIQQVLKAFGVKKTRTTAYHPQGDGMVVIKVQPHPAPVTAHICHQAGSGRSTSLWLSRPTGHQYTPQLECLLLN